MVIHCDIVVQGTTVVFDCDEQFLGSEPEHLRDTLEDNIDIESIPDGERIGTVSFPTSRDPNGNTSFSIHEDYKEYSSALF